MRPNIVLFAHQSPPLLQLLRKSTVWDLRSEPMGDHHGLAESVYAEGLPGLVGDRPDVVVVASPAQRQCAERMAKEWGNPPIVWAAHNGYEPTVTAGWLGPVLCFSAANATTFATEERDRVWVIRPAVEPQPEAVGRYEHPSPLFTMENRPQTRTAPAKKCRARLAEKLQERRISWRTYGQDQRWGFMGECERSARFATSRGYVSLLPRNAGFGLAEHEALAAGCPLYALPWGDTPVTLAGYPGLSSSPERLERALREATGDTARLWRSRRRRFAEAGHDALRTHYSAPIRDAGIAAFLDGLL